MLLWLAVAGWGLGSYPLGEPDEGRNGSAAFEVATEGRWLLPTYDGLLFVDKPLLWFDAAALALRAFGKGELAVRLPSLLFSAATLLLVAGFARRLYAEAPAWIAAAALASSPLVLGYARIAIFDPMLVFFMVLALVLFHQAVEAVPGEREGGWPPRRYAGIAWLAMALGTLTKGPVALAIPLLTALPYAAWRRRVAALWSWAGVAVFGVLVGGWAAYVAGRVPGYLEYVGLTESWGRLVPGAEGSHHLGSSGPIRSLVPILVAGSLPWSVVAAWGWVRSGRRWSVAASGRSPSFLVLWLLVPLLLFSTVEPKRVHYALPMVPAVALLLAAAASRGAVTAGALRAGAVSLMLPGAALLLAGAGVWPVLERVDDNLVAGTRTAGVLLGSVLLVIPAAGAWIARRWPGWAMVCLALPGLLMPVVLFPLLVEVAREHSSEDLARAIAEACPDVPVVGIDVLPASLPFYLGRPVGLGSPTGEPFQSNFVEESWQRIAAELPLFAPVWWQDLPDRSVVVFEVRDEVKRLGAESRGYTPLASNHLVAAYGRGCG